MSNTRDFKVKNGIQPTSYFEGVGTVVSGSVSDLSGSSFVGSFSVNSQATNPIDIHFKPDGTKMYILGNANRFLYQYSLSTAWDVSTASYDSVSLNTDTDAGIPYSFFIKPDGTILYINTSNGVFQYTMSTAWDLSTVSYASKTTARIATYGMWISADGLTFYAANGGLVYQKSLSTAWDISTATGSTTSVSVSSQEPSSTNVSFNSTGTKMYVTGFNTDGIYQYSLSTAFDVTTATYDDKSFIVHDATENFVYGSFYDVTSDRLYFTGMSNDLVYQYSTVLTTATLDLSTGSVFDYTPTSDVQVTLTNPAASGTSSGATLLLTGGAASSYDIASGSYDSKSFSVASQDTVPTGVFFNTDGTKMYITGNTNDTVYQYTLSTAWDVSTASYDSKSFSVSSQEAGPNGLFITPAGTKMFVTGFSGAVYQYTLSTANDISTASYDSVSLDTSSQETLPTDLTFNTYGTRLYISGTNTDSIYEYALTTGFDLSTASYNNASLDVSSQDTNPQGLDFNSDGTKLFVIGNSSDNVLQYTLSTAFDLSTASYDSVSFSVSSQDGAATTLRFGNAGIKMYMIGITSDAVYQYTTGSTATITYDPDLQWSGGTAPTAPAIGETDIITFNTRDGGSTYQGVLAIDGAS